MIISTVEITPCCAVEEEEEWGRQRNAHFMNVSQYDKGREQDLIKPAPSSAGLAGTMECAILASIALFVMLQM